MSDGAVHRELLAFLLRQGGAAEAEREVLATLNAGRTGPLGLLYAAAVEAGCETAAARARAAGCFACFAAGNIADDLADGDCSYVDPPHAVGPAMEFLLLHAAYALWLGPGGVSPDATTRAARLLARAPTYQIAELRARGSFNLGLSRAIAEEMGGSQYAAYLEVVWSGTPEAAHAQRVGLALGGAGFVAEDRRTGDARFTSLSRDERAALLEWAREALHGATASSLPSVAAAVRYIAPLLEDAP